MVLHHAFFEVPEQRLDEAHFLPVRQLAMRLRHAGVLPAAEQMARIAAVVEQDGQRAATGAWHIVERADGLARPGAVRAGMNAVEFKFWIELHGHSSLIPAPAKNARRSLLYSMPLFHSRQFGHSS